MSSSRRHLPAADAIDPHRHARPAPTGVSAPGVLRRAAALFRAAGDPARLTLLERLAGGEYCVSELAAASGERLSTVSERLRVLRAEGLVARRRDGKHVFYVLADAHVADLIRAALDHVSEHAARR